MPSRWVQAARRDGEAAHVYDEEYAHVCEGSLIEFIILDGANVARGGCLAEVVGQGLDAVTGLPLVYVTPLSTQDSRLMGAAVAALSPPSAIHLARREVPLDQFRHSELNVVPVESWRIRDRNHLPEFWCADVRTRAQALPPQIEPGPPHRRGTNARPIRRPGAEADAAGGRRGGAQRELVRDAFADLRHRAQDPREPPVSSPGSRRGDGEPQPFLPEPPVTRDVQLWLPGGGRSGPNGGGDGSRPPDPSAATGQDHDIESAPTSSRPASATKRRRRVGYIQTAAVPAPMSHAAYIQYQAAVAAFCQPIYYVPMPN